MSLRLVPEPLDIGPLDAFSNSDIFEAKKAGERLANIVTNLAGHSVIVLDGPWGIGKSVFVRQWAGLLRTRHYPVVYFDAFAHDHLDDAFFPLLGQLFRAQSTDGPALERSRESLLEKAAPLLRTIPTLLTEVAVRTATGGTLTSKDIRDTREQSKERGLSPARIMIDECLGRVDQHVECVRQFRHELERSVSSISENDAKLPLVFIIDELDRCRPTYALSVLERIKHVFAADGVCFVLVTHLAELTAMVKQAYGLIDADSYLEKFYHRRFDFQKLLLRDSEKLRRRYLDYLAAGLQLGRDASDFATIAIDNLTRLHNVGLRGQERIMLNLALFDSAMPSREHRTSEMGFQFLIASALSVMRYVDKPLFGLASSQDLRFTDATAFMRIGQWIDISPDGQQRVERWLRMATIDGFRDASDEERARLPDSSTLQSCRRLLGTTCSLIDLLGD